jgi:integration host factor subunit beta
MIRSELVQKLASQKPGLTLKDIDNIVSVFFDTISDALVNNDRVEIRGFGAFMTRARNARIGRNPRTGVTVKVDTKRVPHFKSGKNMNERLNP